MSAWGGAAVHTYRLSHWGLCGCGGKCRPPSEPHFAGATTKHALLSSKKADSSGGPLPSFKKPYKEAATLHQRGFGTGSGGGVRKGSRLTRVLALGEHSNTSPHPTLHRKRKRPAGVWAEQGKDSPTPRDPIQNHIPPGEGTSAAPAPATRQREVT